MDDTFYQAFFTGDSKVLGYYLKPFSLGHVLTLNAINSPLLDPEGVINPSDLLIALKVCSMSYPYDNSLKPSLLDLCKKLWIEKKVERLRKYANIFNGYVQMHTSKPRFWKDELGSSKELTAPSILSLAASLVSSGLSQQETWEMSIGKAVWLDAAIVERNGAELRFLYEQDLTDDLPDLNELSDAEVYKIVLKDLGKVDADRWMKVRKEQRQC